MQPLQITGTQAAADLDKQWFGEHGVSKADLDRFIAQHPNDSLVLNSNDQLTGFATFEILTSGLPTDYVGNIEVTAKTMFIQQFTTVTNYGLKSIEADQQLLAEIEQKARELGCIEIWEALAIDHPYSRAHNPDFDAFGFYESRGFRVDKSQALTWQPDSQTSIPCLLFTKIRTQ